MAARASPREDERPSASPNTGTNYRCRVTARAVDPIYLYVYRSIGSIESTGIGVGIGIGSIGIGSIESTSIGTGIGIGI
jgi:hypothetical protein